jgi:hypothetical protein
MNRCLVTLALVMALPAHAADRTPWSGDLAMTYGRSVGQELNVGGLVGEIKKNLGARAALGLRAGGLLGADLSANRATGYAATPVLLKTDVFLSRARHRPFLGMGVGATFLRTGQVRVDGAGLGTRAEAYGARGPLLTVMPELGVDLAGCRIGLQHSFLIGTPGASGASFALDRGAQAGRYALPALGTTTVQLGGHFGAPAKRADRPEVY